MQGKLTLAVGFAAGYVLGSKAGRQRYEEIVAQARKLAGNQTVQSTAGVLQAQASDLVGKAKQTVGKGGSSGAGDRSEDTLVTSTAYSTPASTTYTAESDAFSSSSNPSASGPDLFEPSSTTTDPLATSDTPDPLTDPLRPGNSSGTNGSNR